MTRRAPLRLWWKRRNRHRSATLICAAAAAAGRRWRSSAFPARPARAAALRRDRGSALWRHPGDAGAAAGTHRSGVALQHGQLLCRRHDRGGNRASRDRRDQRPLAGCHRDQPPTDVRDRRGAPHCAGVNQQAHAALLRTPPRMPAMLARPATCPSTALACYWYAAAGQTDRQSRALGSSVGRPAAVRLLRVTRVPK